MVEFFVVTGGSKQSGESEYRIWAWDVAALHRWICKQKIVVAKSTAMEKEKEEEDKIRGISNK
jgi:phage terminase Nu1 subunit (DNA packaging protein)